jgi:hypothetical protein
MILAIDTGTSETGYCLIGEDYTPQEFGKVANETMLTIIETFCLGYSDPTIVVEDFESFGQGLSPYLKTAIEWNGRFIQAAHSLGVSAERVTRREEKKHLLGGIKGNDKNIKYPLIERFAKFDLKTGKGTKKNPDFFYGFAADVWSAFAVGVTFLDRRNGDE